MAEATAKPALLTITPAAGIQAAEDEREGIASADLKVRRARGPNIQALRPH